MRVYKLLVPNLQQRTNNIVELISDIKEPPTERANEPNEFGAQSTQNRDEPMDLNTELSQQAKLTPRELQLKISELKFQRFKLKDDFDNLYKEIKNVDKQIDMNKLSELRSQIKEVEDEISQLQDQLTGRANAAVALPTVVPSSSTAAPVEPEPEFDPIESAFHCLQLAICLLQDVELKTLSPQLRSLCDNLILPNISSVNEELRAISVRALNLICILKLEVAQKYVPLLLEIIQRDKKEIVIEAFKAMINCIMAFSINRLINMDSGEPNGLENNAAPSQTTDPALIAEATSKILTVMTSLLDHEDCELYTVAVEGFCKLYMTGHILSAKLFSKLLIMYYSPLTQNDVRLRACLSAFLPQFSFFRGVNQLCVEESFMITLKCLMNAPSDNYLCEIDLNKVIEILLHLSNPKNLIQRKAANMRHGQNVNICHENIAKSICFEILKDDNAYKCKTYLKILQMADLSEADYLSLKDIFNLANEVHDVSLNFIFVCVLFF
jgi:condensin complex subunit 3